MYLLQKSIDGKEENGVASNSGEVYPRVSCTHDAAKHSTLYTLPTTPKLQNTITILLLLNNATST